MLKNYLLNEGLYIKEIGLSFKEVVEIRKLFKFILKYGNKFFKKWDLKTMGPVTYKTLQVLWENEEGEDYEFTGMVTCWYVYNDYFLKSIKERYYILKTFQSLFEEYTDFDTIKDVIEYLDEEGEFKFLD